MKSESTSFGFFICTAKLNVNAKYLVQIAKAIYTRYIIVCSVNHKLRVMNVGIFNGKLNYHLRLRAASDFFLRLTLGFS